LFLIQLKGQYRPRQDPLFHMGIFQDQGLPTVDAMQGFVVFLHMLVGPAVFAVEHGKLLRVFDAPHFLEVGLQFQLLNAAFRKGDGLFVSTITTTDVRGPGFVPELCATVGTGSFELRFLYAWLQWGSDLLLGWQGRWGIAPQ